jgi:hypothetical protein
MIEQLMQVLVVGVTAGGHWRLPKAAHVITYDLETAGKWFYLRLPHAPVSDAGMNKDKGLPFAGRFVIEKVVFDVGLFSLAA